MFQRRRRPRLLTKKEKRLDSLLRRRLAHANRDTLHTTFPGWQEAGVSWVGIWFLARFASTIATYTNSRILQLNTCSAGSTIPWNWGHKSHYRRKNPLPVWIAELDNKLLLNLSATFSAVSGLVGFIIAEYYKPFLVCPALFAGPCGKNFRNL